MILTVANIKGGVGKTTLAIHLTRYFVNTMRTLLLDSDPQESSFNWSAWRNADNVEPFIDVQKLHSEGILKTVKMKNAEYDLIIVDVAGFESGVLRNLLLISDFLLIPTSLSSIDRLATLDLLALANEAMEYNENLDTLIVFNRLSHISKELKNIEEYKLNFPKNVYWLKSAIFERVAFRKYYTQGSTLFDIEKTLIDSKSYEEMKKFCKEIEYVLSRKRN